MPGETRMLHLGGTEGSTVMKTRFPWAYGGLRPPGQGERDPQPLPAQGIIAYEGGAEWTGMSGDE